MRRRPLRAGGGTLEAGTGALHPPRAGAGDDAGRTVLLLPGYRGTLRPPGPAHRDGRSDPRLHQAADVVARAPGRVRLAAVLGRVRWGAARPPREFPGPLRLGLVRRAAGQGRLTLNE